MPKDKDEGLKIIHLFQKKKRIQYFIGAPILLLSSGAALFLSTSRENTVQFLSEPLDFLLATFLLIATVCAIFMTKNWTCPACSHTFWEQIYPEYCKNCGVKLR